MMSLVSAADISETGASTAGLVQAARMDDFIINPWLALIALSVLVITGAVAVIREIEIEEEDRK